LKVAFYLGEFSPHLTRCFWIVYHRSIARDDKENREKQQQQKQQRVWVDILSFSLSLSSFRKKKKELEFCVSASPLSPRGKKFWEVYFSLISLVRPSVRPSEQQKKKKNKKKN